MRWPLDQTKVCVSSDSICLALLSGLLVYREWFHSTQMQKLVDKIMSGNYYGYKVSENLDTLNTGIKIPVDDEPREDLGALQSII